MPVSRRTKLQGQNPLSGKMIITAEAAERYGISDLDVYKPKSLRGIYGGPPAFDLLSEVGQR
jgi:hypothetical protein